MVKHGAYCRGMLNTEQKRDLCYHADIAPGTLAKIYAGKPVFRGSYVRVIAACERLKIPTPPSWVPAVVGKAARKLISGGETNA